MNLALFCTLENINDTTLVKGKVKIYLGEEFALCSF